MNVTVTLSQHQIEALGIGAEEEAADLIVGLIDDYIATYVEPSRKGQRATRAEQYTVTLDVAERTLNDKGQVIY